MPDFEFVRDDDPRRAVLEQAGYTVVGESWGARLRDPDRALLEAAVLRAAAAGLSVRELGPEYAQALRDLETTNAADYPYTPATAHTARDLAGTQDLWLEGGRVFGALDGERLVGATVIRAVEDRAETAFTSVLPEYRGKGIGQAVKAASILALLADGCTLFGTGGAGLNAASLGANEALGYTVEERWYSYAPPGAKH
ncbi:GNAT family N-acetyltransferase [Kribbella sp. VKM Ac-2568]|uniref:GNAT family N-acetyltransferase n=1 Tax=Kribbella sp. VKM Ac-2568 TaxID=2512219 RepID=UPI00104E2940|nr:GNAT family N-acetyltransferase [Kribbella sp. VKM Ac-2568]TCM49384.1 acetyltransferase (GNAT) family protein [Kribbella sp. VKM Ac-2568]